MQVRPSVRSRAPVVAREEDGTRSCDLSRRDLAAGVHDVFLLADGTAAVTRLLSEGGATLARSAVINDDGGLARLELGEGAYRVECRWPGEGPGEWVGEEAGGHQVTRDAQRLTVVAGS